MKDYTTSNKDKKTYILNYEIAGDEILVTFADGEVFKYPYSTENEKKILNKMREQLAYVSDFKESVKKEKLYTENKVKNNKDWKVRVIRPFAIGLILTGLFLKWPIYLIISIFGIEAIYDFGTAFYYTSKRHKLDKKINSIREIESFLKYEDVLNKLVNENKNITNNINRKTKQVINHTDTNEVPFTLNTIDKVSLIELRKMIDNIKREETLGIDEDIKSLLKINEKNR